MHAQGSEPKHSLVLRLRLQPCENYSAPCGSAAVSSFINFYNTVQMFLEGFAP
jgi:hypothetical protein